MQMAYFDRILRRANLRLMTMSSGQYELKRQENGEGKKEKAGLELNVIDHYNGTERSVKHFPAENPSRRPFTGIGAFR